VNFSYPITFEVPIRGFRRNIAIPFGVKIVELPDGVKTLRMHYTGV